MKFGLSGGEENIYNRNTISFVVIKKYFQRNRDFVVLRRMPQNILGEILISLCWGAKAGARRNHDSVVYFVQQNHDSVVRIFLEYKKSQPLDRCQKQF